MKKFWQTEKFKHIERVWEEKLRQSGFEDIENNVGRLKQNAANSYRTSIVTVIENKLRYFELLGHHLHEESFMDEVHKLVMQRRSEGVTIKNIGIEIKQIWGKRSYRGTIRKIIQHYEMKWKIRKI